jgi:hypothetical protein
MGMDSQNQSSNGNPVSDIAQQITTGLPNAAGKGAGQTSGSIVQNVTPITPVISGTGLQDAQSQGMQQIV